MKCGIMAGMTALVMSVTSFTALHAEETTVTGDTTRTLEQMAQQAKEVLAQERVQDTFDLYRKLKDFGVTYQSSLTAPNNLVGQLDDAQLRMYAGVKLFDAIYAASFMERKDASDAVAVIEQIQDALQLRSYADLNNYFLHTLKKAATRPDEVDIPQLINQLAADYVNELPDLFSSVETADYLIDSLYGFYIEMSYITGAIYSTAAGPQIEEGLNTIKTSDMYKMLLDAFGAFNRMDEEIRISGKTQQKLAVIRKMYDLDLAEENNKMSEEDASPLWMEQGLLVMAIRASILTPLAD